MPKTLTLSTGQTLTIRSFTESEAIAYADKEAAAASPRERLADYLDDGDEEVLGAVTAPDRATMLELLEEYPKATRPIAAEIWTLTGTLSLKERAATAEELAAHLNPATGKPHRLLVLEVRQERDPALLATLILRKLSRMEAKFQEQEPEVKRRGRVSYAALAKLAKLHTLAGADASLWERLPTLSMVTGTALLARASVALRADEGK